MFATRMRLRWMFGMSFTLGAIAVAAIGRSAEADAPVVAAAGIDLALPAEPAPVKVVAADDAAPPQRAIGALAFAFVEKTVDGEVYIALPGDAETIAHGKVRVVHEKDGIEWNAIAKVAAKAAPANVRDAIGSKVVIASNDGKARTFCTATIDGFAIIRRVSGDGDWDAKRLFGEGEAKDFVAHVGGAECLKRVAEHGAFARDAALAPAAIGADTVLDVATAEQVKADLYATDAAKKAIETYSDPGYGDDKATPWKEAVSVSTNAFIHPLTGERWIAVRAFTGGGCGERTFDLAGLYRQTATGKLVRVWAGNEETIEQLVDVDGDGTFEMVTAPSEFDTASQLLDANGHEQQVVRVPYYGCPC